MLSGKPFLVISAFVLLASVASKAESARYPLRQFDNIGCTAKGRVQDCNGKVMQQILADGKNAIPMLIAQLTETTPAEKQIADYWHTTQTGDIAFIVLEDLFSGTDGKFNMPGAPDWDAVMKGCSNTAETCWYEYLHKHGRKFVQQAWLQAWNQKKNQIDWDAKDRCFRMSEH